MNEVSQKLFDETKDKLKTLQREVIFKNGLQALELAEKLEAKMEKEGHTQISKRSGLSHPHPCMKLAVDARKIFMKTCLKLRLEMGPIKPLSYTYGGAELFDT